MTELKCPICERDMVFIESPDGFDVFVCTNSKCKCCGYAGKNIWEHIANTKKKLDVAVSALKRIRFRGQHSKYECCQVSGNIAEKALEQINQKEEK